MSFGRKSRRGCVSIPTKVNPAFIPLLSSTGGSFGCRFVRSPMASMRWASLILNQASFEVVDVIAADLRSLERAARPELAGKNDRRLGVGDPVEERRRP